MTESVVIRSYQRIFRPERRLYQIDGRPLPVPGGVPLRWLAWAIGTLLCVLVVSSRSETTMLLGAAAAGLGGLVAGGRVAAVVAGTIGLVGLWVTGFVIASLEAPLRLVVVPALVATLATQVTPDGRRADRFALSWLRLRVVPARRSLGRPVPDAGRPHVRAASLWVAGVARGSRLGRGRVRGPATMVFPAPVAARFAGRRVRVRALPRRLRRGEAVVRTIDLAEGETAEVGR